MLLAVCLAVPLGLHIALDSCECADLSSPVSVAQHGPVMGLPGPRARFFLSYGTDIVLRWMPENILFSNEELLIRNEAKAMKMY